MPLAKLSNRIIRRRVRAYERLERLKPRFDMIVDRDGLLTHDLAVELASAIADTQRAISRQSGWRPRISDASPTAGKDFVTLVRSQYVLGSALV